MATIQMILPHTLVHTRMISFICLTYGHNSNDPNSYLSSHSYDFMDFLLDIPTEREIFGSTEGRGSIAKTEFSRWKAKGWNTLYKRHKIFTSLFFIYFYFITTYVIHFRTRGLSEHRVVGPKRCRTIELYRVVGP